VTTLRERYPGIPVLVTTLTRTGAVRARTLFKISAQVRYIPFDLPGSVRRFSIVSSRAWVLFSRPSFGLSVSPEPAADSAVLASARILVPLGSRYGAWDRFSGIAVARSCCRCTGQRATPIAYGVGR